MEWVVIGVFVAVSLFVLWGRMNRLEDRITSTGWRFDQLEDVIAQRIAQRIAPLIPTIGSLEGEVGRLKVDNSLLMDSVSTLITKYQEDVEQQNANVHWTVNQFAQVKQAMRRLGGVLQRHLHDHQDTCQECPSRTAPPPASESPSEVVLAFIPLLHVGGNV